MDDPEEKEKAEEMQKAIQNFLSGSKNADDIKKMEEYDISKVLEHARKSTSALGYETMKALLTETCKDEWEQFKKEKKLVKIFDKMDKKFYHISKDNPQMDSMLQNQNRYLFEEWDTFGLTKREKNENNAAVDITPATKDDATKDERSLEIESMTTWLVKSCHFQHQHALEVSAKFVDDGYDSVELIIAQIKESGEGFLKKYIERDGLRKKMIRIAESEDPDNKPHEVLQIEKIATVQNPITLHVEETKTPAPAKIWGCVAAIFMFFLLHVILVESLFGMIKLDPSFRVSLGFLVPIFLFVPSAYILTKEYVPYFPRLFAYAVSFALIRYAMDRFNGICWIHTFDCAEEEKQWPLGFLMGTYLYLAYVAIIELWWIWDDGPIRRCCRKKYKYVEE